jgi:hypothetical protein
MSTDLIRGSFAGHQTFAFRYSWPKKAVDEVAADGRVFGREDAMVRFGVGKNMVASIRHWALALGLIEEDPDVPNNRGRVLRVTRLGEALLGSEGWDPYLEDPGTLWLLHWQLANEPDAATTWWWTFNRFPAMQFTRRELQLQLSRFVKQYAGDRVAPASLKRDIDCFVLTYARSRRAHPSHGVREDALDCPLVELGLVIEDPGAQTYRLARQERRTLPRGIFAYALTTYLRKQAAENRSVSLDDLAFGAGSPGRVFGLAEEDLLRRLEQIETLTKGAVAFDETAGLKQLYVHRVPEPWTYLQEHYRRKGTKDTAWRQSPTH